MKEEDFFRSDEKHTQFSENNYNEQTVKGKKSFGLLLILLLVGIPIILIIIILIIFNSTFGKKLKNNQDSSKEMATISRAISDLHQTTSQIEIASDIYESASDSLDDVADEAQAQAINMFNSKFTAYEGKQRASVVKAIIQSVTTNNSSHDRIIELKGITDMSEVNNGSSYDIKMKYNDEGYINEIVITEAE